MTCYRWSLSCVFLCAPLPPTWPVFVHEIMALWGVTCTSICMIDLGRVHTTLFLTGRDRSRPVRAQFPVSTREQPERSFRFLETTSRHGTSGRDRSRSVAPCQLCRVDARPGASNTYYHQWKVVLFCIMRVRLCRHSLHTPKILRASTERIGGGDA